jgi:hypothetical protein
MLFSEAMPGEIRAQRKAAKLAPSILRHDQICQSVWVFHIGPIKQHYGVGVLLNLARVSKV